VWHGVYGPDLVDVVLDLMMDGMAGAVNFFPPEGWSQAEWVRRMAAVAECDALVVQEEPADSEAPAYPGGASVSWSPPSETTIERFVREARLARSQGERGVHRREDEPRLEDAAG
jgi:dTDP-4-dehydrorhamnose reductase